MNIQFITYYIQRFFSEDASGKAVWNAFDYGVKATIAEEEGIEQAQALFCQIWEDTRTKYIAYHLELDSRFQEWLAQKRKNEADAAQNDLQF